jgi:hypothetical protein
VCESHEYWGIQHVCEFGGVLGKGELSTLPICFDRVVGEAAIDDDLSYLEGTALDGFVESLAEALFVFLVGSFRQKG